MKDSRADRSSINTAQNHPPPEARDHNTQHQTRLQRARVGVAADRDGQRELGDEDGQSAELAGEDEVEEGPELGEAVLDGAAAEDEAVCRLQLFF